MRSDDSHSRMRLYRFAHIKSLRAALRVKVLQLGLGVGVLLPSATLLASGTGISMSEGITLAGIVGGTLAALGAAVNSLSTAGPGGQQVATATDAGPADGTALGTAAARSRGRRRSRSRCSTARRASSLPAPSWTT